MPNPEYQVNAFSREDTVTRFQQNQRTVVTTAATLTAAQSGSYCYSNGTTGTLYTLPAASVANLGVTFFFGVLLANTSGAFKIITAGGALLIGSVSSGIDATTPGANPGPKFFVSDGSTHISVSMNGTTSGGLFGTYLRFTCVSATQWEVSGQCMCSGTIITPFATS